MSRANRLAMAPPPAMGPPQDTIMGPPPVPAQAPPQKEPDLVEKYRSLKRKYFELEEKHKECIISLRSSGERNIKWRHERQLLMDRIAELQKQLQNGQAVDGIPGPIYSAYPKILVSSRNQKAFDNNLRLAIEEFEAEDPAVDPVMLSRHIGPEARKRQEAELKERQEEEAREARRAARRPRAPKGKEQAMPLTYAPVQPGPGNGNAPILVSSSGTRLRLKPPAPPAEAGMMPPSSSAMHSQPHQHPPPPPPPQHGMVPHHPHHPPPRSESPMSPVVSPREEYPAPAMLSPHYHQAGPNSVPPPPPPGAVTQPPSQMQMTLRTSSSGGLAPSRPSDMQRHTKPKRLKAHTVQSKSYSIPMVPRDQSGRPLLPLTVGIMTVHNLGEVCMREHFHTERYIFPIGYEVQRRYLSTIDPNAEVVYHCTILDGGDGPKFRIIAADRPHEPIYSGTATGAWSSIVKDANLIRNRQHSNSVSGPDFFGLGQNTIKHLIQELPNARQLKDYVWQHFIEGGPLGGRHAPVTPALPDEHEERQANGYFHGRDDMDVDRPGELRIIPFDGEDPSRGHPLPPPPHPHTRPLTFHQEYPDYGPPPVREGDMPHHDPPRRERRGSRASVVYDDYGSNDVSMRNESPRQHHSSSHSPSLHRERDRGRDRDRDRERERERERDRYSPPPPPPRSLSHTSVASPHSHHRSPYQASSSAHAHNGEPGSSRHYVSSPPPVPAPFASIMHAYPAMAPGPGPAPNDEYYASYSGSSKRNGHAPMRTFPSA